MDLTGIKAASGLTEAQLDTLCRLVDVWKSNKARNRTKMSYYEDTNKLKNLGMAVPAMFAETIDTSIGWAAKAVDYLASRSQFDGFTSGSEELDAEVSAIMADNDIQQTYSMAVPSELVHGCGFWTVSRGAEGEQRVVINYHDALTASALWDYRHKRIEAGMVIAAYRPRSKRSLVMVPSIVMMHMPDCVVTLYRGDGNDWRAVTVPHRVGSALMVPMCYRPSDTKPFGKSRISRPVMAITDEMQREVVRAALHSECYSAPQKYMVGASEGAFEIDKFSMAYNSFMLVSKDEDGDTPTLGQFSQSSMTPHIEAMESLMSRMAAETSVPVAAFGLSSNGYTSSDALRASTDDLILEAESLNRTNGKALRSVALMALAISRNVSVNELKDEASSITCHWVDPSMPSMANVADAMVKICAAVPEFGGTDVYWEKAGFNEDERRRIRADVRSNRVTDAVNAIFSE